MVSQEALRLLKVASNGKRDIRVHNHGSVSCANITYSNAALDELVHQKYVVSDTNNGKYGVYRTTKRGREYASKHDYPELKIKGVTSGRIQSATPNEAGVAKTAN